MQICTGKGQRRIAKAQKGRERQRKAEMCVGKAWKGQALLGNGGVMHEVAKEERGATKNSKGSAWN